MYIVLKGKNVPIKIWDNIIGKIVSLIFRMEPVKFGLFFPNCNWTHTFFMYHPIDVAMTDEKNKILYLYQGLKPWQIITPKEGVAHTYVFSFNMLNEYSINDTLKVKITDK